MSRSVQLTLALVLALACLALWSIKEPAVGDHQVRADLSRKGSGSGPVDKDDGPTLVDGPGEAPRFGLEATIENDAEEEANLRKDDPDKDGEWKRLLKAAAEKVLDVGDDVEVPDGTKRNPSGWETTLAGKKGKLQRRAQWHQGCGEEGTWWVDMKTSTENCSRHRA